MRNEDIYGKEFHGFSGYQYPTANIFLCMFGMQSFAGIFIPHFSHKSSACSSSYCFAVSGFFILFRNKTTFDTSKSTRKIVTNGVYRFSRNPLYFSLLLLLSGAAILLSSLWLFFAIPILYVLFLFKAVKPEEKYLLQKFGEEYLHYSEKVRRWI
jgi:protein-S-isoprenylcysteine O-methyltransferase Ste14